MSSYDAYEELKILKPDLSMDEKRQLIAEAIHFKIEGELLLIGAPYMTVVDKIGAYGSENWRQALDRCEDETVEEIFKFCAFVIIAMYEKAEKFANQAFHITDR